MADILTLSSAERDPGKIANVVRQLAERVARATLPISLRDFGATGDGVTDDTAAITRWLAALLSGTVGFIPPGTYKFTSAISKTDNGNFSIDGAGAYQSVFLYAGASTTADLFTIGDGVSQFGKIDLDNFKIDSSTTMTGGNALRLKQLVRSNLSDLVIGGQDGNNKLWDGVYFDQVDLISYANFDIKTLNDGVKIKGGSSGPRADLFMNNGKIGSCGRCGIVVGGGFGGLYVDACDIIANGSHGVIVDQSLSANGNRELFFGPGVLIDSNGGSGVHFDNGLGAGGYVNFQGVWFASNASHGINVSSTETAAGRIQVNGGNFFQNTADGIRITPTQPTVIIDGALFRNNGGWGINNAGGGTNARIGLNYYISNTSGTVTGANFLTAENGNYAIGGTPGSDRQLTLARNATGATAVYGIRNTQQVQTDVTAEFNAYATNLATVASSFTLALGRHFVAQQGTIGAGSAVTDQYGFVATSTLTGATNNYGFRSEIAAAANRWNFYASGAAENFFAGPHTVSGNLAIPAGGTAGAGLKFSTTANFGVFFGSGVPTLSAAKGSLYLRSDGTTTNDRAYINTNGSTTWTALTTAA